MQSCSFFYGFSRFVEAVLVMTFLALVFWRTWRAEILQGQFTCIWSCESGPNRFLSFFFRGIVFLVLWVKLHNKGSLDLSPTSLLPVVFFLGVICHFRDRDRLFGRRIRDVVASPVLRRDNLAMHFQTLILPPEKTKQLRILLLVRRIYTHIATNNS